MRGVIALIFLGMVLVVTIAFVARLNSARKIEVLESQIEAQYQKIAALSYNSENINKEAENLAGTAEESSLGEEGKVQTNIEESDISQSNKEETTAPTENLAESLIEKIKVEINSLTAAKKKLETDLTRTVEEKATLETQIQQLETTAKTSEEKYRQEKNNLQALLDNRQKDYQVLELKLTNLKKDRDKTVELKDKAENELSVAKADIKNFEQKLSTNSQTIDGLKKKLTETQKVILDTQGELKQVQDSKTKTEAELNSLTAAKKKLETDLSRTVEEKATLETQIQQLEVSAKASEEKLSQQTQNYEKEKERLQTVLDNQKKDYQELQLKLANLQKDKESIEGLSNETKVELVATKGQIKGLEQQLSTNSQTIDELNKKLTEAQKVILDTQGELKQVQNSKTNTEAEIKSLTVTKDELEKSLVKAAGDGTRFKIQVQQLEAATKVFEEKLSQQTQDYEKEKGNLQALLDNQKKGYQEFQLQLANMKKERDSIAESKGKTESELSVAKAEIASLEQKLNTRSQTIDELNKKLVETQKIVSSTQEGLRQVQNSKANTDEEEIKSLTATKDELERSLSKAVQDKARLEIQVQQLETASKTSEGKYDAEKNNYLQTLLDNQKKDYEVLQLQLANMKKERDSIAESKGKTESELSVAKAEIASFEQKLNTGSQTIDELNKKLAQAGGEIYRSQQIDLAKSAKKEGTVEIEIPPELQDTIKDLVQKHLLEKEIKNLIGKGKNWLEKEEIGNLK